MQYREGARVYLANGEETGRLERVVIDPRTMEVTHLVVKKGMINSVRKLVPAAQVQDSGEHSIHLQDISGGWDRLLDFEETEYHLVDENAISSPPSPTGPDAPMIFSYPPAIPVSGAPYGMGGMINENPNAVPAQSADNYTKETRRNIPEGQIAFEKGVKVVSHDGAELGSVEEVFTNAESGKVSHLLISSGMLLKERKMIPVEWVDDFHENEVRLGVNARFIENLPDYREQ